MAKEGRGDQRPPVTVPEIKIPSGPRTDEGHIGAGVSDSADHGIPPSAPSDTSTASEQS
jgi:hypothetical protein